MPYYNVHIYREMRVMFPEIAAETHSEAARIASELSHDAAAVIDECEGDTFSALVDVVGDEEYQQTRMIDFEPERLRKAAPDMLAALEMFVKERQQWAIEVSRYAASDGNDLYQAFRAAIAAIAKAKGEIDC